MKSCYILLSVSHEKLPYLFIWKYMYQYDFNFPTSKLPLPWPHSVAKTFQRPHTPFNKF